MLEWVISAAALTALVIALRYLLRGRVSLRLQYALWGLVLLRLLLPVSFGSAAVSVGNLAREPARLAAVSVADASVTYDDARAQVAGEYAQRGVDIAQLPPAEFEAVDEEIRQRMDGGLSLGGLLFGLWLGGVGVVGAVLAVSNLRFAVRLRRSRARLDMPQCRLPVYVSERSETPCLFGLLRPAIYLTPQAAADDVMLRHAVAHELTHFRHGDHIWSILRGVCLALHWYDPLVWWAAVLSRNDCELACDEATIRRLGEDQRAEYGRTLIAMTCQKRPALLLGATTMTGGKNSLKERIVMIAKKPKTALCTLLAVLLIAAVAAGCAFTGSKEAEEPLVIQTELDPDLPAPVVDYAVAHVQKELDYYTQVLDYDVTEAKLVGLTQITTGTAALNSGQNLYRMEYRFRVADPDKVALAGGMRMEGDAITEWGSGGQPYLLVHYEDRGEERIWTQVCVTNDETIQQDYGTPEMLEEYGGNMYTAAAMELYVKHTGGWPFPAHIVDALFGEDEGVMLTLHLADQGAYNTYGPWYAGKRLSALLSGYNWRPLDAPSTEPSDYWLTAASPDGSKVMTFYSDSGAGTVTYTDETRRDLCWAATPLEGSESIAQDVRWEYDNLDVDYRRIAFPLDGNAQAAAEHFVHSAYGDHMTSLAPGNMYAITDYRVIDWGVQEVSDEDDAVVGSFTCAVTPVDFNSPGLWAGNTDMGTGDYDGMLTYSREFVLELQDDGLWHCIDLGTGGCALPERAAPSESSALSDAEVEAARQAAMDYYAGTVFEVSALTALTPDTAPFWEGEIVFRVSCSKGGEAQPDRTVALARQDGVWTVINEGY